MRNTHSFSLGCWCCGLTTALRFCNSHQVKLLLNNSLCSLATFGGVTWANLTPMLFPWFVVGMCWLSAGGWDNFSFRRNLLPRLRSWSPFSALPAAQLVGCTLQYRWWVSPRAAGVKCQAVISTSPLRDGPTQPSAPLGGGSVARGALRRIWGFFWR